jgi:hypothetical protein
MKHTRSHRVPEHARSVGEHAGVRRAPCDEDACAKLGGAAGRRHIQRRRARYSELWGNGAVSGERGGESTRGDEDAGAHARHMRRRTQLRQLTLPPRPISRVSSASLPLPAASNTASPIESLIASAALYRPSPARIPADSGGARARLRGDAREAAARTPSRCACAARPQAPRSSGGRGSRGARARRGRSERPRRAVEAAATRGSRGPEQVVVAAAAVARGRVEDVRCDRGAQSRLPQRLAPEAPSRWYGVVWVCEAAGSRGAERVRSRPSGFTRALGNPP